LILALPEAWIVERDVTELVTRWIGCVLGRLGEFNEKALNNSMLAFEKLATIGTWVGREFVSKWLVRKEEVEEFVTRWIGCVLVRLEEFDGLKLYRSMWALRELARKGLVGKEKVERFVIEWIYAVGRLEGFDERALTGLILDLPKAWVAERNGRELVSKWICALEKLEKLDGQGLSNLVRALPDLTMKKIVGKEEVEKFVRMWICALEKLREFDVRALSGSIQAFALARSGVFEKETRKFVIERICALGRVEDLDGEDFSNLIRSLARTGAAVRERKELVSKWIGCVLEKLKESNKQELFDSIRTLRMFAKRGLVGEEEVERFVGKWIDCAFGRLQEFNGRALTNSILDLRSRLVVGEILDKIVVGHRLCV
jgi:hypothetical protein